MDVLPTLLPPSFTAKAEPSSKDSHKQRHQQKKKDASKISLDENIEQEIIANTINELSEIERRAGEDRRRQRTNRGRWLESRERNDRRATDLAVFVTI